MKPISRFISGVPIGDPDRRSSRVGCMRATAGVSKTCDQRGAKKERRKKRTRNGERERVERGPSKESETRSGPPVTPVKSTGMDSHTRLELCTTLWGQQRSSAPYGDPWRCAANPCPFRKGAIRPPIAIIYLIAIMTLGGPRFCSPLFTRSSRSFVVD